MNHKPLFLTVALIALLVIAGAFWYIQNRPPMAVNQPVVTEPAVEEPAQTEPEQYQQHVEVIPGNTDQVWYEIPEMGIKLLLSKEAAEELVYKYSPKKDADIFVEMHGTESQLITVKDIESSTFFWKKMLDFRKKCDQSIGHVKCIPSSKAFDVEFYISKIPGIYNGEEIAFGSILIGEFPGFYIIGANRRESYGMFSEDELSVFETTVQPNLPKIPSLKNIRMELLEEKR